MSQIPRPDEIFQGFLKAVDDIKSGGMEDLVGFQISVARMREGRVEYMTGGRGANFDVARRMIGHLVAASMVEIKTSAKCTGEEALDILKGYVIEAFAMRR